MPNQQQKIRLIYDAAGRVELSASPYQPPEGILKVKLIKEPISGFSQEQYESKFVDSPLREFYKSLDPSVKPKEVGGCGEQSPRSPLYPEGLFYDYLLINKDRIVTEGTRCNFYTEQNNQLITSPVSSGLLPGTYRDLLIQSGCRVKPISLAMLEKSSQCYISNALIGKRKVVIIID